MCFLLQNKCNKCSPKVMNVFRAVVTYAAEEGRGGERVGRPPITTHALNISSSLLQQIFVRLKNVFVQIAKCVCLHGKCICLKGWKAAGAPLFPAHVLNDNKSLQLTKCICPNCQMYLSKWQNLFAQTAKYICLKGWKLLPI